jgi:serine/threonine-protein kinase
MPFIEGENLAERVSSRGPLPVTDAVRSLREVAWALAYAHARGVVHRDVKPENIMIERGSGRAIVTDFGIARVEFGPVLAQDALIMGTASYMSPEQIDGEPLDGRSDLYSLGIVGFLVLSGRLPFTRDSISALLDAQRRQPAPPLASVAPQVPTPIAAVIDRCLAKERDARYPTGESLADALEKALRLSEPELLRDGTSDRVILSAREAARVIRHAAALQLEGTDTNAPSVTARDLEAAAAVAGVQARFVRQALETLRHAPERLAPNELT